jgi:hypothetical protein
MLNFILQTFNQTHHWPVIYFGWQRGWVKISEIADYATSLVEELPETDSNLTALASFYSLNLYNIEPLLQTQIAQQNQHSPIDSQTISDIWRLAHLVQLQDATVPPAEKLKQLQLIYAEFDYPEEMQDCFIYTPNSIDPLLAMTQLITTLQQKLRPFTK